MTTNETAPKTIKEARLRVGLSMREAAREAGFNSPTSWSTFERGLTEPRADRIRAIANALLLDVATVARLIEQARPAGEQKSAA